MSKLRPWWLRTAAALLCIAASMLAWRVAQDASHRVTRWDFSHYYLSALSLRLGQDPYTTPFDGLAAKLGLQAGEINRATYPPTFLLLIEPLATLPEPLAYWIWQGLNAVLLGASLVLLIGPLRLGRTWSLILAALAIIYSPVEYHFYFAQCEIPILFLSIVALRLLMRRRDTEAGLCLGLAILIKVFPVILAGYLLVERRWRALVAAISASATGVALAIWRYGFDVVFSYSRAVSFVTQPKWLDLTWNISPYAVTSRFSWLLTGDRSGFWGDLARAAGGLVPAILVLWVLVRVSLRTAGEPSAMARTFAMWVTALVLLSPTAWTHYMVLFLIFLIPLAGAALKGEVSRRCAVAAGSAYLLAEFAIRPLLVPAVDVTTRVYGTSAASLLSRMVGVMQFFGAAAGLLAAWYFCSESHVPAAAAASRGQ